MKYQLFWRTLPMSLKKIFLFLLTLLLAAGSFPISASAADPNEILQLEVPGQFRQTEARTELELVNGLRTQPGIWYWNKDDTTKTVFNEEGGAALQPLVYDYELEKIAMQRAVELAVLFSHTRPNGQICFSLLNGYFAVGENIASGYGSAESVFTGWCEEDEPYQWQGHRRNMLSSDFTAFGAAAFRYNGRNYWVQAFGRPASGAAATAANDETAVGIVESLRSNAEAILNASYTSIKIYRPYDLPLSEGEGTLAVRQELRSGAIDVSGVPAGAALLAASYDENGRFLGLSEATEEKEAEAAEGASEVTVFCIDEAFAPLSESLAIPMER